MRQSIWLFRVHSFFLLADEHSKILLLEVNALCSVQSTWQREGRKQRDERSGIG